MPQSIGSLNFVQQSDPSAPVAVYPLNFATDQVWNFTLQGTSNGTPVMCNGVTVDNTGNPNQAVVTVNGIGYPIAQNSRQRVDFNGNPNNCVISSAVAGGNCVAQFFVKPPAPNDEGLSQVAVQTQSLFVGGVTAGSANAQTIPASGAGSLTPAGFAFSAGVILVVTAEIANTGPMTLSVAGGPATTIYKYGPAGTNSLVQLAAGDFAHAITYLLVCDTDVGAFVLIGAATALQKVVQIVSTGPIGAVASGATAIPLDDTIPQNTEGDQYMSLAVTPQAAGNIITVEALVFIAGAGPSGRMMAALFQDANVNALATAASAALSSTITDGLVLRYRYAAPSAATTTFKIRAGGNAGGVTFNGEGGARLFGGSFCSHITITETLPP